jgi:diguanylate cyclase (GGDEF)-like protein
VGVPAINTVEQAWALRNSDRAAARSATEILLTSADANPRATALARVVLSYLDYRERRYAQAATASLEALAVLEANPSDPWLPRLYNTLAIIHFDLGERDTSRAYLDRQIHLSHELGDHTYEALGYHDLGLLQAAVDIDRGLATLEQARALFHASDDAENEALALYNMANIHQHTGQRELAASAATEALQLVHASVAQGMGGYLRVHLATLKAEAASELGRHSEAQGLLDQARALATQHFPELLPHVQFCQGLHLTATGDDAGACNQFENALMQIAPSGSSELLADCHAALADCYERLGDYRAALGHHRAYTATRERTFIETSEQKVRALDVIHQVETAHRAAEAEHQRNIELQRYIDELEQLHATVQAISVRDPLTDLHNRRYLAEEGERLLRYAQRYQTELCAAMIDIDSFKQINDTLGHPVGDLVLQRLAEIITLAMRGTDLIIRYGGEEIALLLPSTSIDDAYSICERLRMTIEQHDWASIHPRLRVTVSIGVAKDNGNTLTELLSRADVQLYVSKRGGRNRTSYGQEEAE